ncbi:MAG: pyruvate:ferredoxin (flavodoxin) oxidoreductase [Clostridiales bacterium]|jgi:pyruvate-ferredoxin/flavodoxin oxidoreductase|nr:pyruvate:ferredoxin (flavodoxin) oxidoreductase [Clostridiales bacterium]
MQKNMRTMDGNMAAAYASYAFTEVAGIYPITPSSTMAEHVDEWAAHGKKNLFGQEVRVSEMQSEAGASGAVHGSLAAGALTTTYTASQGLLLMIPNMYKIAGELLPGVFHVSARTIASHALSIFGDHSDVMACRQTGFALLASSNVQDVMNLSAVAHLSAINGRVPFLHFFDGFRTSHEIQKIEIWEYEEMAKLVNWDAIAAFRKNALNPEHPVLRGSAQNPDIFFQVREASNRYYDDLPAVVEKSMADINNLMGTNYKLFNYYGAPDADRVIVAMGSVCDIVEEVVDYLNAQGQKTGVLNIRLYRPFVAKKFLNEIPSSALKIAVLDRTKEPGALGEPLYQDVCTAFFETGGMPKIVGGRYGLSSKDVTPAQIIAVFDNLNEPEPKNHFTVGIVDDVTNLSLPLKENIDVISEGVISAKFWGLGSDGTVGANKNSIKIIGDNTDMYAQAYFEYDSKKSGGVTKSHLRFGKNRIRSSYYVTLADFVACHNPSYVDKYDMVGELKDGGTFLLNCVWSADELDKWLPANMRRALARKKINFYIIDGIGIARKIGLKNRINSVLQAAFFKLTNVIPADEAVKHMKYAVTKTYGNKGEKIVSMNHAAIDAGMEEVRKVDIPADWADAEDSSGGLDLLKDAPKFITDILAPVNAQKGDTLPVSAFIGHEDGTLPSGTAAYEKRGIAIDVPEWIIGNCIQCNQCSYVCPHATIRPFLLDRDETLSKPDLFETKKAIGKGFEDYDYRIQVDALDCVGCGNCAQICPAKDKALVMKPIDSQRNQIPNWEFAIALKHKENPANPETVKGSQFEQPLLEFSGACAGCGETPYAKLVTQLFGDRMYIANATGCTSIWGGSAPSTPYTRNHNGHGPAWANSLFEDNAEYGLGMALAVRQRRDKLARCMRAILEEDSPAEWGLKEACSAWLEGKDDAKKSREASRAVRAAVAKAGDAIKVGNLAEIYRYIAENDDVLVKKSQWIFGGDGWAYDIGFGGLDHVLAYGEDVNVLVLDTEVYSNTGGQSSKSSPAASVAKFAASGKKIRKKDLGMIAMSYGYVYVAQVALGANQAQCVKALVEAEKYPGPSIIIAYAPCINHGIRAGMGSTPQQTKNAVEAGYWHLYRYNPALEAEGKNPFSLDSKDPTGSFQEFLNSEVRYSSLKLLFPEEATGLFEQCENDSKRRLATYKRLATQKLEL